MIAQETTEELDRCLVLWPQIQAIQLSLARYKNLEATLSDGSKEAEDAAAFKAMTSVAKGMTNQAKILNAIPSGSGPEAWKELKKCFESVIAESEQIWRKHADQLHETALEGLQRVIDSCQEAIIPFTTHTEEEDIEKLKQSAFEKKLLLKAKKDRVFETFQDVVRHERAYTNVCGAWWDQLSTDQGELDKAKTIKDKAILQMWIHSVIECVFGRGRNTTGARAKEVIKEGEGLDKEDVPAELIKALEAKAA